MIWWYLLTIAYFLIWHTIHTCTGTRTAQHTICECGICLSLLSSMCGYGIDWKKRGEICMPLRNPCAIGPNIFIISIWSGKHLLRKINFSSENCEFALLTINNEYQIKRLRFYWFSIAHICLGPKIFHQLSNQIETDIECDFRLEFASEINNCW